MFRDKTHSRHTTPSMYRLTLLVGTSVEIRGFHISSMSRSCSSLVLLPSPLKLNSYPFLSSWKSLPQPVINVCGRAPPCPRPRWQKPGENILRRRPFKAPSQFIRLPEGTWPRSLACLLLSGGEGFWSEWTRPGGGTRPERGANEGRGGGLAWVQRNVLRCDFFPSFFLQGERII